MKQIESVIGTLVRVGGVIGVACILLLTVLTVATVGLRVVGVAFAGSYALSELLLMPAVTFSLTYAAWENTHTRVNFISGFLSQGASALLEGFIALLGLVFWGFIALATFREAVHYTALGEMAAIVDVPVAPFRWLMVTALVLMCAVILFHTVRAFSGHPAKQGGHE